jgi:hypothetical protein
MKEQILAILQNHSNSFIMDIEINDLIATEIVTRVVGFIEWIINEKSDRMSEWMRENDVDFLYDYWLNNIKK